MAKARLARPYTDFQGGLALPASPAVRTAIHTVWLSTESLKPSQRSNLGLRVSQPCAGDSLLPCGRELLLAAPALQEGRTLGFPGFRVKGVLLISTSSTSPARLASRPGGRLPRAPHTQYSERTLSLAPNPRRSSQQVLQGRASAPRLTPRSSPSPALL